MGLRQLLHPSSTAASSSSTKPIESRQPTLRPPFIIFTQTIPRAQALFTELQYDIPAPAGGSARIAVLHSSLSHRHRTETMTRFRQGKIWILITTDLLSRGIDFRGVNGIVNYDIPTTPASYVHRAGRTGRAGRQGGTAVTFYTRDDIKYLKPIANIISASEKSLSSSSSTTTSSSPSTTTKPSSSSQLPSWLIPSLPHLTSPARTELKARGVPTRRAPKPSDNDGERRAKLLNRIGSSAGGYERRVAERTKGMREGSLRRKKKLREDERNGEDQEERKEEGGDEWEGLGD